MRKFLAMLLTLCMLTAMGCASAEDTVGMLEQIVRFADAADCQTALTFVGRSLYVAVNSMNSIFDAALKTPVAQQLSTVRAEAEQLRRAGELLVLEADGLSRMEHS